MKTRRVSTFLVAPSGSKDLAPKVFPAPVNPDGLLLWRSFSVQLRKCKKREILWVVLSFISNNGSTYPPHVLPSEIRVYIINLIRPYKGKPMVNTLGCPPSQDSSHHQDYYIISGGSQPKPSFATVTGRGDNPRNTPIIWSNYSHLTRPGPSKR